MGAPERAIRLLYSECPECHLQSDPGVDDLYIPCIDCGCPEVENVWSDGQRTEAFGDCEAAARGEGS